MRHAILLVFAVLFSYCNAVSAQPYRDLGRDNPLSRFYYERSLGNTSQDVGILRERSLRWMEREFGTGRVVDSNIINSPDTIRNNAFIRLPNADGLKNITATFRLRVMPSGAGIYFKADNFLFRAYDAVTGEFYLIPFEEAWDYFEGNALAKTRQAFDDRFEKAISQFDRLGV